MTLKEFSVKHHVPYNVVHKASLIVKPIADMDRSKDYGETELYNACMQLTKRRLKELKKLYEQYVNVYNELKKQ